MKKLSLILLALVLIFTVTACSGNKNGSDGDTSDTQSTVSVDAKTQAKSCIDKSVKELYKLIGQPNSTDYMPSCLNPGNGEDGFLFYDGFTVYTYRSGDNEVIVEVE